MTATLTSPTLHEQGSMLPYVSPSNFLSYATGGPAAGQMWISFGWTSQSLNLPDQSTLTIPAPPAAPAAPTLGQVAGGALGARTRWAKVAYHATDVITGHESVYPVSTNNSSTRVVTVK